MGFAQGTKGKERYRRESVISEFHCIRLGSVRSSHLPFKMHLFVYVRSSLPILMHVGSIATPYVSIYINSFLICKHFGNSRFEC